jgi:hypothetical protein
MPLTGFVCEKYVTDKSGKYVGTLYCRIESIPPGWVFRPASQNGPPDDKDFTLTATDTDAMAACDQFLKDSGYIGQGWGCPDKTTRPS